MKKINIGIYFLLIAGLISCYQSSKKKPLLTVQQDAYVLGKVEYDSSYLLQYRILNRGEADLLIDTVSASCDCTVPVVDKMAIRPGDSALLSVSYKPVDTGFFLKKVVIKSNADSVFTIVQFSGQAVKGLYKFSS